MSEFKAFTRREIDVTRIDKKSLDVSMSERSTVKRSIYPQGHLSGLFRLLQQPGLDMSRFVIDVDLDDPWFQRRQVRIIPRANFDKDAISSIHVDLDYQGTQKSVLLTKDSGEQTVSWASVLRDGAMVPEVTARYTVTFGDIDGTERPKTLVSEPVTVVDGNLEIDPRQLYSMVTIPLECTLFPWDRYGIVEVALKHDDEANQIAQSDVIVLSKDKPASEWLMFVRDPERKSFSYRVRYLSADHADREDSWTDTDEQRITVRDPLRAQLQLDVVPVVKWADTDRVFVDVRYADDVNQIFEQESFEFTENAGGTQTFRVGIADVHRRRFEYEVTVIMKSTEVIKVPRSETAENRIIVREDMRGHRIIDIGLAPVDFAARSIKRVAADLLYEDPEHGLNLGKAVTFSSADAVDTFEYDYVEGGPEDYKFQYRITFTNNLTKGKAWAPTHDNPLRIDIN
jgi:hypothetical protein